VDYSSDNSTYNSNGGEASGDYTPVKDGLGSVYQKNFVNAILDTRHIFRKGDYGAG